MSGPSLLELLNLLLLPATALLWRIDVRLARVEQKQQDHERRLIILEGKPDHG